MTQKTFTLNGFNLVLLAKLDQIVGLIHLAIDHTIKKAAILKRTRMNAEIINIYLIFPEFPDLIFSMLFYHLLQIRLRNLLFLATTVCIFHQLYLQQTTPQKLLS